MQTLPEIERRIDTLRRKLDDIHRESGLLEDRAWDIEVELYALTVRRNLIVGESGQPVTPADTPAPGVGQRTGRRRPS